MPIPPSFHSPILLSSPRSTKRRFRKARGGRAVPTATNDDSRPRVHIERGMTSRHGRAEDSGAGLQCGYCESFITTCLGLVCVRAHNTGSHVRSTCVCVCVRVCLLKRSLRSWVRKATGNIPIDTHTQGLPSSLLPSKKQRNQIGGSLGAREGSQDGHVCWGGTGGAKLLSLMTAPKRSLHLPRPPHHSLSSSPPPTDEPTNPKPSMTDILWHPGAKRLAFQTI